MLLVPWAVAVVAVALVVVHAVAARARRFTWWALLALAVVMLGSGTVLGLAWAPPDRFMGDVQRIMYVHVPQVWMAMLAVAVVFTACVVQLWTGSRAVGAVADAAGEVGLLFGAVGLGLGAVWGRTTWGVWWSWDPRMTSTAGMLLVLAVGVVARRLVKDAGKLAVVSAVLAAALAAALPVVAISVVWWSSLHQLPSTTQTMDPAITFTLRWNTAAFLCLFLVLVTRAAGYFLTNDSASMRSQVAST